MSVANTAARLAVEAGNDSKVLFDFSFKIFAKTDLKCWKVDEDGVYTLGVVDVDYTVVFDTGAETGSVQWTVAPVTDGYSVIQGSALPETQGVNFPRDGVTPSNSTKLVADKLTILAQQLNDVLNGRAILKDETLDLTDREDIVVSEAPVDRRTMIYERNDADDGWNIVPSSYDPDALVNAAAVLATAYDEGLAADRPVAPTARTTYYSTDTDTLEIYIVTSGHWRVLG